MCEIAGGILLAALAIWVLRVIVGAFLGAKVAKQDEARKLAADGELRRAQELLVLECAEARGVAASKAEFVVRKLVAEAQGDEALAADKLKNLIEWVEVEANDDCFEEMYTFYKKKKVASGSPSQSMGTKPE